MCFKLITDEPPYYFDFVADLGDTGTHPLQGTKLKILEYGEEVEIVFQSTNLLNASNEHSLYIQGHKFYVLGEGYGNFNSTTDPETYNLVDPPYLSTASLPVKGWLTIRFKANNPGVWAMHSQEGRHLIWGMNTVLIVKNGNNPETSIRSPLRTCLLVEVLCPFSQVRKFCPNKYIDNKVSQTCSRILTKFLDDFSIGVYFLGCSIGSEYV
ncbi:hypothetical protein V6N13_054301 [Hibiscus sabdariffa]|uniref:Plastocyanin-like domain-containing protein n=1 Tax=Hibiscus sabdariffa TaxID=183260 RepID=A0ABR2DY89_9ROSI